MAPLLGCIADDFTGATDLASMLVKNGMRTIQMIGVPREIPPDSDAIIIALKSRTVPADQAVSASLDALAWLQNAGCQQFFFKYCSTFDSTDRGNIGPVADAVMETLKTGFTIACPAFPANGRTVYQGHLFVGKTLLNESGMQNHPLTPMTDPNLVRVLQRQSKRKVGLVPHSIVLKGASDIHAAFLNARQDGVGIAIVDATSDVDLREIGRACKDMLFLTGGSGLAMGLPANFREQGLLSSDIRADQLPRIRGFSAAISGSCSLASQRQVAVMKAKAPAFELNPMELAKDGGVVGRAVDWAIRQIKSGPVLIYSTNDSSAVKTVQREMGAEKAGALVENALAEIAALLVDNGVTRLVIAGGETSGAIVRRLDVHGMRIGPEIDPGVPWTVTLGEKPLALALKSGNFGTDDFFLKAWNNLP
jgi:3-dehydrotetronate 4-kinase